MSMWHAAIVVLWEIYPRTTSTPNRLVPQINQPQLAMESNVILLVDCTACVKCQLGFLVSGDKVIKLKAAAVEQAKANC